MSNNFTLYNKDCPWYDEGPQCDKGKCLGQVTYNQHVNDPRYPNCEEYICPFFYWKEIGIAERK